MQTNIINLKFTSSNLKWIVSSYIIFITGKMKINAINIMSNLQVDEGDDVDLLNIYLLYCNLSIVLIVAIIDDSPKCSLTTSS